MLTFVNTIRTGFATIISRLRHPANVVLLCKWRRIVQMPAAEAWIAGLGPQEILQVVPLCL
jgi:hypothetical protein